MKRGLGMVIGLGVALVASAQTISVRSDLETDSIMIGDQIVYGIHVEAADHVEIVLPHLQDTLNGDLEIIRQVSMDTLREEGRKIIDHTYLITGFEAGIQMIPPMEVRFRSGERWDTAQTMPLVMTVYEPAVDTTAAIRPIKPPINTPLSFRELIPWIGLGLGIALVVALLIVWYYYLKKKRIPGSFLSRPSEPAHVIAFRELDRLKEAKMWERGETKRFYTRLTEIIRKYVERQYGILAMESTTEEIMHDFRKSNLEDELLDEILLEMLEQADLVKFAKEEPLPVDNQTHLNNAYIFVQKTFPLFHKEEKEDKKVEKAEMVEELANE